MSAENRLGRFFRFRGRAGRAEFWSILAIVLGVSVGLVLLAGVVGDGAVLSAGVWGLVTVIPLLSVTVRRLHDYELSGWWMLLALVPVVGVLFVLWVALLKGTDGPNRFGPEAGAEALS